MKIRILTLGLGALLVLSACGGSSSHYESPTPPVTTPPPPVSMVDAFFTAVLAIIGDGSETTTEPQAIDSIVATAPEDTEPVVLK
ncbi:hypothetical protein [Duganella margarita]|uniref:hypothetical protein n=1 Tax=Duganella margarita TaxID=2692170 RepID=UPI001925AC44|nr:hypothetical protein [Duganella margarita]